MAQLEEGNIDLDKRPIVVNKDGSYSTVRSMSFQDEKGAEVLVPTVHESGRIMSEEEAIKHYYATGKHLGKFTTPQEATAAAKMIHESQAKQYGKAASKKLGY